MIYYHIAPVVWLIGILFFKQLLRHPSVKAGIAPQWMKVWLIILWPFALPCFMVVIIKDWGKPIDKT